MISIEDKNFESHWGVNIFRVLGAAYHDLTSNGRAQGASTLTMQLARNLFLSTQQTFGRKLQEVFLSIQIEHVLYQGADLYPLRQPDLSGAGCLRIRGGIGILLQQTRARSDAAGSGPAGGFAQRAGRLFSHPESRSRLPAHGTW